MLNLKQHEMKTIPCTTAQFTPLDDQEIQTTSGGIAPLLLAIVAGASVAASGQIFRDWENFKAGLAGRSPVN
jgi:lactobin A/cerein 7B family class IIb bacteriocin